MRYILKAEEDDDLFDDPRASEPCYVASKSWQTLTIWILSLCLALVLPSSHVYNRRRPGKHPGDDRVDELAS